MKVEILFLGKTKDKFITDGIDEYTRRLEHYCPLSVKVLKSKLNKQASDDQTKSLEADLLLSNVEKGSYIVALDSRGKQLSSEGLSRLISKWEHQGRKVVSFLIGGPVGLSPKVIEQADMVLSFSQMTFTHDMIRMLLLEQLYRSYTIKRGEKYHK